MNRLIRLNKLPSSPPCERLRPMEPIDVPAVTSLLNEYLSKFKLTQVFSEEDIAHFLLPRPGVIQTMVVPGEQEGDVTDFFSFYFLNSHVMKHEKHVYFFFFFLKKRHTNISFLSLLFTEHALRRVLLL